MIQFLLIYLSRTINTYHFYMFFTINLPFPCYINKQSKLLESLLEEIKESKEAASSLHV